MDIDIDTPTKFVPTQLFKAAVPAAMLRNGELVKHPCGHYFQDIPTDEITGLAAIPFREAEEFGYFKVDFLHLSVLDYFENKNEIRTLLKLEPNWNLLLDADCVSKLFQLKNHHSLLCKVRPRSIQELADCVALIRPAKKHLLNEYLKNRDKVRPQVYRDAKSDDKSSFRRSHAISYAMTIVLQLHLIDLGVL